VQPNAPLYLLASGDINDRGEITGLGCVVVSGACGPELHTFVAIVARGADGAAWGEGDRDVARPAVAQALWAQLLQRHRFGNMRPERAPAQ
jgi:hypothetical protein